MTAQLVLHRGKQKLKELAADGRFRLGGGMALHALAGFLMSGGALRHQPMPLAMALVSVMTGWRALATALGAILGYRWFWGAEGVQGMVWSALAAATALLLGKRSWTEKTPLLIPAFCGLWTSGTGLVFQLLGDQTAVFVYLLRVSLSAGCSRLFDLVRRRASPFWDWLAQGVGVLALAQTVPLGIVNLGCAGAAALAMADAFPAAALAGIALDLARISPMPMTALCCAVYLARLLPWSARLPVRGVAGLVCAGAMALWGRWDWPVFLGFAAGGFLSALLPPRTQLNHRRGETGTAQVRLELMANVLTQTQQLLLDTQEPVIDEAALLERTRERACGSCPNRKGCDAQHMLHPGLLHRPLTENTSLPIPCRKPGRMILELRRSQEQLRRAKADRDRRRECRQAVIQQYRFLAEYLRSQADLLPRRAEQPRVRFTPESAVATQSKESANGDACLRFHGPRCRYYVLLCDGMGTGTGAAREAGTGAELLQKMLTAGFPAEQALESLNSLTVLRGRAGAVTVDLAELRLDTGRATLYKWGAAPSYILTPEGPEKIGTAGPPPGLGVGSGGQRVERLSLGRGETLILLSDGLEAGEWLQREEGLRELPPGELAAMLLRAGGDRRLDDATAAVIRLCPAGLST